MTARDLISRARQLGGSRRADASDLPRAQVLLLDLAAALEAAQREPIGYAVLAHEGDIRYVLGDRVQPSIEAVHDAVAETREFAAQLDLTDEPFIETYSVVELREVEGE